MFNHTECAIEVLEDKTLVVLKARGEYFALEIAHGSGVQRGQIFAVEPIEVKKTFSEAKDAALEYLNK